MIEIEQYLQAGDTELRVEDIKTLLEEHNNMKQDIKRLKEEYMMLQNASDEVEEKKDREIERLNKENDDLKSITNIEIAKSEMLEKENKELHSIIKEVREYIEYQLENLDFEEDTKAKMLGAMVLVLLDKEKE